MVKRRIGVALVAGSLLTGAAGAGWSDAATSPYQESGAYKKCIKRAKRKPAGPQRKKAKRRCKKKFRHR